MDARDKFLADVAARLPLPAEQRSEVLEELAAHLSDATADLVGQGRDPAEAEAEALRRLGSPDALAHGLLQARRTTAQLLVAAGAGTWAAIRTGVLGGFAGWLLFAPAALLVSVAIGAIGHALGSTASLSWTGGWNSVLTAAGLAVGAFLAGAAAVRAVSARAWRMPAEVRLAVSLVGIVVIGSFALIALEQALNWPSVCAFLLVPVAFGVGARFERVRLPSGRRLLVTLLVGILLVVGTGLAVSASSGWVTSYQWTDSQHGYQMIGPWWQDPAASEARDFPSGDSSSWTLGVQTLNLQAASSDVAARFRDYRLEAWRADPPGDGWRLTPGQRGPFATAPAQLDGTTVSGTIRFNQAPGVDWAQVVLTAIGPESRRYLLYASGPEQTEFFGSVWAWFSALGR